MIPVTALEVVLMGLTARSGAFHRIRDDDRRAAARALELVGIESLGPQLFRSLSAGQKQRVLLSKALVASPDVLVLDEPTSGMDIASEAAMLEFLRSLNAQRHVTIALVTHMLPIVLNLATTIMLVSPRGIVHGTVNDVLQEDRLTDVYGVPVHIGRLAGQRTLVVGEKGGSDV
jgi:ABC-type Mn2+/Zn2+ transport system ATPase subunit